MAINKRQAAFIMQLPDGFEWEFMMNGTYIVGHDGKNKILAYKIVDEKLIQEGIVNE